MRPDARALAALAVLLASGCAAAPAADVRPATRRLQAAVIADVRSGTLEVTVRAEGVLPPRWRFEAPGLVRGLRCRVAGAWRALGADGVVELPAGATALRWRYAMREGESMRTGRGSAGGYAVHGCCYLGRPEPMPDCPLELTWRDPRGEPLRPLLPWKVDAAGRTRIAARELWNPGFHTFGGRRHEVRVDGGRLEVAILPGPLQRTDAELLRWLKQAAREVCLVRRGTFPHPRIPVVLIPSGAWGGDVVPFGTVQWSTPQSVALLVRNNATPPEMRKDWVAVHELMHLAHPCFRPHTPWLSEGLATYYQMVARMRSGRRSDARMWGWFRTGVRRGRRDARERPLSYLSEHLGETYAYVAVYWGGALLMLDLDIAIRAASENAHTLDDAVRDLLSHGESATVDAFAAAVDAAAGRPVFAACARRHLDGPALRLAARLFERLGVVGAGDAARLTDGPLAEVRRRIERP